MAQHFRLSAAARTISLGQVLRMVDAEVETTFAPAIWWRLLHKSEKKGGDLLSDGCTDGGGYGRRFLQRRGHERPLRDTQPLRQSREGAGRGIAEGAQCRKQRRQQDMD